MNSVQDFFFRGRGVLFPYACHVASEIATSGGGYASAYLGMANTPFSGNLGAMSDLEGVLGSIHRLVVSGIESGVIGFPRDRDWDLEVSGLLLRVLPCLIRPGDVEAVTSVNITFVLTEAKKLQALLTAG